MLGRTAALGYNTPRPQRGWPMLAAPELAKKIVEDVVTFSQPYGTAIDFRDGVGVVRIASTRSNH